MLVLSRYKDQRVFIGNDVVVTIVDVRGDRVRIGIEAPPWVTVDREEVANEIATLGGDRRRAGQYQRAEQPRAYDLEVCLK